MDKKVKKLELMSADFDTLIGEEAILYLPANNTNQFQLGTILFEVVEDEQDDYRSSMKEVSIINTEANAATNRRLEKVIIKKGSSSDDDIFYLESKDGHKWLEFGTRHVTDYYPTFIYSWTPKESDELKEIKKLIKK